MPKRLIICCDGTWDDADAGGAVSNVVRIARAIEAVDTRTPDESVHQIVYYHSGVGTGADLATHLGGGAIGLGLSRNVRDAYAFIASNYCDGDEIFLFGFSRGAYTARSISGLIGWTGILHKRDLDDFALVWESFKLRPRPGQAPDPDWVDARLHFDDRHKNVMIQCVGVWDTVGALGIPGHVGGLFKSFYEFHDTDLGTHIRNAFHALAIDEHRKLYEPTLWRQVSPPPPDGQQTLEQVWFAGAHANVGGGYDDHGLSDIALAWMASRVDKMLEINWPYLADRQDWRCGWGLGEVVDSATGFTGWFGRVLRPVMTTPGEQVHESVRVRQAAGAGAKGGVYAPANLAAAAGAPFAPLSPAEQGLRWGAPNAAHDGVSTRPKPRHLDTLLDD
jgi:uncharacterized protein (DUF2235 family)